MNHLPWLCVIDGGFVGAEPLLCCRAGAAAFFGMSETSPERSSGDRFLDFMSLVTLLRPLVISPPLLIWAKTAAMPVKVGAVVDDESGAAGAGAAGAGGGGAHGGAAGADPLENCLIDLPDDDQDRPVGWLFLMYVYRHTFTNQSFLSTGVPRITFSSFSALRICFTNCLFASSDADVSTLFR